MSQLVNVYWATADGEQSGHTVLPHQLVVVGCMFTARNAPWYVLGVQKSTRCDAVYDVTVRPVSNELGGLGMSELGDRLIMADSQLRAEVLVQVLDELHDDVDAARDVMATWFNTCDALAPWADRLRAHFERLGYVTDCDDHPVLPCTVYRAAWADDDPLRALSWTMDLEFAKCFARGLFGPRARFVLGTYRPNMDAVIWRATCLGAHAYFTSRHESEIVPSRVTDIVPLLTLSETQS